MTETQLAELFISIGADRLDDNCHNFIRLLAENRRLKLLPEIAALFEIQRRDAERHHPRRTHHGIPATAAQQAAVTARAEAAPGARYRTRMHH